MNNRIIAEIICRLKGLAPVAKVVSFGFQQKTALFITNHTPITITAAENSALRTKKRALDKKCLLAA